MTLRRVILCIVLVPVLLLALAVGLYFLRGGERPRPRVVVRSVERVPDSSLYVRGPTRWVQDAEDAAAPRLPHTSMRTLEAFVVDRLTWTARDLGPALPVSVSGGGDESLAPLAEALRRRLAPGKDWSQLLAAAKPEVDPADEAGRRGTAIELSWRERQEVAVPWWPTPIRRGAVRAKVVGPKGSVTVIAELDEKPWLETAPAEAGRPTYAVVSTDVPAISARDAEAELRQRRIELLVAQLDARVQAMPGGDRVPRDDLYRRATMYLVGVPPLDRAVVRVDRNGPRWYAAELIEVVPGMVEATAHGAVEAAVQARAARTRTVAGTVVALPGMLLVLGGVYLGLNALTRGYFRGHLRAAALAAVAVVAAAAVVLLMG
jgi:hypothetical protein